jgi:hypothetical protein
MSQFRNEQGQRLAALIERNRRWWLRDRSGQASCEHNPKADGGEPRCGVVQRLEAEWPFSTSGHAAYGKRILAFVEEELPGSAISPLRPRTFSFAFA